MAVVFCALVGLAIAGALTVALMLDDGLPAWAALSLRWSSFSLARRWLPSKWRYRRVWLGLLALLCAGLLVDGVYDVVAHGEDLLLEVGLPTVLLLACWSWVRQGPAGGRSPRTAVSAASASAHRRAAIGTTVTSCAWPRS